MLAALGVDSDRRAVRRHPAPRSGPRRSTCPSPSRSWSWPPGSQGLAGRNRTDLASFLGAGVYRHWTPPAVDQLLLRGEWYTAYTPYQPEVSQGTLQSIYEYESLLAELVDLDVVSRVALRRGGGHGRGGADDLPGDPPRAGPRQPRASTRTTAQTLRDVLRRRARARGDPARRRRRRGRARPTSRPWSGCWPTPTGRSPASSPASPNFLGLLEPMAEIGELAHAAGALFVAVVEPVSLAVLAPPGAYGADIAAGEGQPLGIAPQYGGPYLGHPRLDRGAGPPDPRAGSSGMTTDLDGQRAFVMTLRAREQDIRRDKAASNICTNQALLALAASHLSRDDRAARPARRRGQRRRPGGRAGGGPGGRRRRRGSIRGPYLNEFAVRVPDARAVHAACSGAACSPGLRPGRRGARRPGARRRAARLRDRGHHERRDRPVRARRSRRARRHRRRRRASGAAPPSGVDAR